MHKKRSAPCIRVVLKYYATKLHNYYLHNYFKSSKFFKLLLSVATNFQQLGFLSDFIILSHSRVIVFDGSSRNELFCGVSLQGQSLTKIIIIFTWYMTGTPDSVFAATEVSYQTIYQGN